MAKADEPGQMQTGLGPDTERWDDAVKRRITAFASPRTGEQDPIPYLRQAASEGKSSAIDELLRLGVIDIYEAYRVTVANIDLLKIKLSLSERLGWGFMSDEDGRLVWQLKESHADPPIEEPAARYSRLAEIAAEISVRQRDIDRANAHTVQAVAEMRRLGATWQDVAKVLGTSKQVAHYRYGRYAGQASDSG